MYEWQNNNEKGSKFSTMRKYVELYSETDLFDKLSKVGLKVGVEILFYAMLLFYLLADKSVSVRNKLIIMAALGYFILPTDLIADFIPVLGFTDDAAFLSYALTSASSAITPEVKQKAKEKIKNLFNDKVDSSKLDDLAEAKSDSKEKKD
jgi:uncharacterized membrane protein YkvA (DUF1232 family)